MTTDGVEPSFAGMKKKKKKQVQIIALRGLVQDLCKIVKYNVSLSISDIDKQD